MKNLVTKIQRWFSPRYELTVSRTTSDSERQQETVVLSRITKLTTRHIRGFDEQGLLWELRSEQPFDYRLRRTQ